MAARRAVSTRTRFEIFKRDGFRCIYCGATPVQRPLHCDHVVAVANGGSNKPENLVTACGECNLGKNAVPLGKKRFVATIATTADKDHSAQILEFLAVQREITAARERATNIIADRWEELIGPMTRGMYERVPGLMATWMPESLDEAMQITGRKLGTHGQPFVSHLAVKQTKYFYGILRRWAAEQEALDAEG